jgi:hypothetical protein
MEPAGALRRSSTHLHLNKECRRSIQDLEVFVGGELNNVPFRGEDRALKTHTMWSSLVSRPLCGCSMLGSILCFLFAGQPMFVDSPPKDFREGQQRLPFQHVLVLFAIETSCDPESPEDVVVCCGYTVSWLLPWTLESGGPYWINSPPVSYELSFRGPEHRTGILTHLCQSSGATIHDPRAQRPMAVQADVAMNESSGSTCCPGSI